MARRIQWVNFPDADGRVGTINIRRADFVDRDVKAVGYMGPIAYVKAEFEKKRSGSVAVLTMKPEGGNARYSPRERARAAGIFSPTLLGVARIAMEGVARFRIKLPPSGGDRFKLEVAEMSGGSPVKLQDEIETRRKLYYQLIRMSRASKITAFRNRRFRKRFWDTGKKLYLKLEEVSPGKKIPNRINFNDTHRPTRRMVERHARRVYDNDKAPYAVAVVFVNKNCIPKTMTRDYPHTLSGNSVTLTVPKPLFHKVDPAAEWYLGMWWTSNLTALPEPVPKSRTRVMDAWKVRLDMSGRTRGAGTLTVSVRILDIEGLGLSDPRKNLCTVASRGWKGDRISSKSQCNTIVHELAHKIGIVPGGPTGQGDRDLDKQTNYYDGRDHQGPHCHTGAPLRANYGTGVTSPAPSCTMFGDNRTETDKFCTHCLKSVRKVDVTPKRKRGLRVQF